MGTWVKIGLAVVLLAILIMVLMGGLQAILNFGQWLFRPKGRKDERDLVLLEHGPATPGGDVDLSAIPVPAAPHGRKAEMRYVHDLLRYSRVVTLLGADGTGKSVLAGVVAEAARAEFAAVWGFSFAADPTKAGFLDRLGGKRFGKNAPASPDLEGPVLAALAEARRLFVLDDFEAVLSARAKGDPDAAALYDLLGRTGKRTHLLIVARQTPTELFDEDAVWVPRIERDAAVRVLHEALAGRRHEFHEEACHEIVDSLDRHPLACRLVGGYLALDAAKPKDAAARVHDLVIAARATSDRPSLAGLAVALDLCLGILSPEERNILHAAAAFPGPFAPDPAWGRAALDRLAGLGLLDRASGNGERLRMHAIVREGAAKG